MKKTLIVKLTGVSFLLIALVMIIMVLMFALVRSEYESSVVHFNDADYAIILGAPLIGERVSSQLKLRLDTAVMALADNDVPIVVTGGNHQHRGTLTEAEAMRRYLVAEGIAESRIIVEDRSSSTYENLKYAGEIIDEKPERIIVITSDFHMYRAKMIARRIGYDVEGVSAINSAKSRRFFIRREMLALLKDIVLYRK